MARGHAAERTGPGACSLLSTITATTHTSALLPPQRKAEEDRNDSSLEDTEQPASDRWPPSAHLLGCLGLVLLLLLFTLFRGGPCLLMPVGRLFQGRDVGPPLPVPVQVLLALSVVIILGEGQRKGMREDLKEGNHRPHPLPGPPYHLGVGVIVEAGLGVIVVARCLVVLVGRNVGNSWGQGGR